MTKADLSQLFYLNREIEQQKRRIAELEAAATNCNAKITGMPHVSGAADKIGDYASEIADLKCLIELNMQKCWYEVKRLNKYITSVEDCYLRHILMCRFVLGMTWTQVAIKVGGGNTADSVRKAVERFLEKS